MASPLSFNQIRAEVTALARKRPVDRPVGIRAPGRWLGEPIHTDGDMGYVIRQCDSPLAIRRALREAAPSDLGTSVKVIVTNLPDEEISRDIFGRLHRQRFFSIDRWSIVQQQFAADSIDSQLAQHDWLADAVIEHLGNRRPVAVKSGCLVADTLWRELLAAAIGFVADVPDVQSLLRWSLDGVNVRRYRELADHLRSAMRDWVCRRAGAAADFVFAVADRGDRPDAVPLALVAGVLVSPEAAGRAERSLAFLEANHLIRRADGRWSPDLLKRVAGEAASLVLAEVADPLEQRRVLSRAEELLRDVDAVEFAHASPILPIGLTQRLKTFAAAVREFTSNASADIGPLVDAAALVRDHDQTHAHAGEQERLTMAMRLARWLASRRAGSPSPRSLAEAASDYLATGSFVDWARDTIGRVAETRELSDAVTTLQAAATQEQEKQAEAFGRLLENSVASGVYSDDLLLIERVLDDIIVPLARQKPVLLVVLDGMSAAVCRELVEALTSKQEWQPIVEAARSAMRPVLATIPSETRYSRASLLAGRLVTNRVDEVSAFATHPGLAGVSSSAHPPKLYTKADIQGNSLTPAVRDDIASDSRRVVGVIVNAVDDHLGKADQLTVRWTLETLELLKGLLYEARSGGRAVVFTSDHGHVLDRGTTARVTSDGGSRWRPSGGTALSQDELMFHGSRVLVPGGELVTTWSEGVRYIATTNRGYHGGVNPQEMIVPLAVLIPGEDGTEPAGWQAAPEATPLWWDESDYVRPVLETRPARTPPPPPPSGTLFDKNAAQPSVAGTPEPVTPSAETPTWLEQVFATPDFAIQKKLVSRGYAGDDLFKRLLAQLDTRGGKMTKPAIARAIGYPPFRMTGLLSQAQRLFNVDGYPVITVDIESDTVSFERRTMLVQFGIPEAGSDQS